MDRRKLGACLAAAIVTLASATHLAQPAHATARMEGCTEGQLGYAEGYADGECGGSGGTVDSCEQTGGGGFTFAYTCNDEDHQKL